MAPAAWRTAVLVLAAAACVPHRANGKCVRVRQDLGYCDMVDYKVYASLNVPDAEKKAEEIGEMHIGAWRDYVQHRQPAKPKKKKMGSYVPPASAVRLPFCESLIKATTCNLLMPPCDGDGSQRYRKPCKAFFLALQLGCNWTMNVGDLSFAEPPDCFELPIRAYTEAEYLDAAALGAEGEADSGGRADDILKIAALLDEEALTEHAVFMYLQALRYRSDDTAGHLRAFALVHSLQEHVKSLQSQLEMAQPDGSGASHCWANAQELDFDEIALHKGLGPKAKIRYILQYAEQKGSRMFYETGVWYGETINGLKGHFERLVSIEISEQIAELARKRFANDTNVEIITGDSLKFLPEVLRTRDRRAPAVFWLDGHFSGSRFETAKGDMDTPILAELDMTLKQAEDHDVVLIDDARLFRGYHSGDDGTECSPAIEDLRRVLCGRKPHWSFEVEDDLIRMEKDDAAPPPPSSSSKSSSKSASSSSTRGKKEARAAAGSVGGSGEAGATAGGGGKGAGSFGPSGPKKGKIPSFPGASASASGGAAAGGEGGGRGAGGGGIGASHSATTGKVGKSQRDRRIPSFGGPKPPPSGPPPPPSPAPQEC